MGPFIRNAASAFVGASRTARDSGALRVALQSDQCTTKAGYQPLAYLFVFDATSLPTSVLEVDRFTHTCLQLGPTVTCE